LFCLFGGIVDHHCWEVIVCFVDIGGIVDHHCLDVIVCFVDIGGIVDHPCWEVIVCFVDGQQFHQYKKKLTITSQQ
jgi:hypothetical protein